MIPIVSLSAWTLGLFALLCLQIARSGNLPPATERFLAAAREAGCSADQVRFFLRSGIIMQGQQLKACAAAILCDSEDGPNEVGYGGARGGGKSFWGLAQLAYDCYRFPGLKALYLRKVGKAGREAVNDLRRLVLHSIPHEYKSAENKIVFPNGSVIILGHFQAEKDIDNYLGLEYDVALIEEATQLSARKVKDISTCVRTSKPGWRPRKYFTTNPGNIGHAWFKARFIDPMRKGVESKTRFVQATVYDNACVNREYREELEGLTGWQRRAWLDGVWDIAAGQFFTNFRREAVVAELGPLPGHWRVWMGFDYGFGHYTAAYLLAADGDGNVWVVDEHCERGWVPEQHAEAIKAMCRRHGVKVAELEAIKAGWDCFNRDRNGRCIADDYEALGLEFERADADRINGAAQFVKRFGDPDGKAPRAPTLFIDPRCERLIECIPALQRDPNRGEDVLKVDCDDDGNGGDDFYDGARYGLMHYPVPAGRASEDFS